MAASAVEMLARHIRQQVVEMTHRAQSAHVGGGLSVADILAVLYGEVLRIDPRSPKDPQRDRLVFSKGHACAALYACLAERGFFPKSWLEDFYANGGRLAGHATHWGVPGVEVSTGSLGHGLPISCGMALAGQLDAEPYRVFCVLSDGECDEGSTWEAALFAGHHRLTNLVAVIDYNQIQSLGHVSEVLDLAPLADKWRAFGWSVREVDGHDPAALAATLAAVPWEPARPNCLVAHTVKGKGVRFMEDQLLWHYRSPQGEEYHEARRELGAA